MHKVVFHVDEMDKWQHTLGNIRNLLTFGGRNLQDCRLSKR